MLYYVAKKEHGKWISVLKELMKSSPCKRSKRVKEGEESSPDEDENEERIYSM